MCGICGFVSSNPDQPIRREMLARMTATLRHRGPDGEGSYIRQGIGLGVRRLSIIDIEGGNQPISNEDETVTVVCNGEIYNYIELRQHLLATGHRFRTNSDVEVIVHLYEDHAGDFLRYLRGMFGLALWDARQRRLILARDRLGIKPLYYLIETEGAYFGSEIKPILISHRMRRQPNVLALRDLFTIGFVIPPKTLFSGIHQLLPGHILLYQNGNATVKRYWQVSFPPRGQRTPERSLEDWSGALFEKLQESVRIHLRSDVPVAAWLSGGIDSSSIAGLMSRLTDRPLQVYSLTFDNHDYDDYDEFSGQKTLDCFPEYRLNSHRLVCGTKDFNLFPKALWHSENIGATGIGILYMILAQSTAQQFKVVLTGEGSDEIFGGYGWYQVDKLLRPMAGLPSFMRRLMLLGSLVPHFWPGASRTHLAPREMNLTRYQSMIGPRHPEHTEEILSEGLRHNIAKVDHVYPLFEPPAGFEEWNAFTQLQYYDLTLRLPNFITHHLDRSTMAHSLEARVPFLDHELVEFCANIPPRLKMKRLQEKYILRQAVRTLLPEPIVRRKKKGLRTPYEQWLREKLPDFAEEMFSETKLSQKGYFNPSAVTNLLNRHRTGERDFGTQLMGILAVQLWDELFMKDRLQEPEA
jgi:asparagine synthase (glutamine-hydrolysing)